MKKRMLSIALVLILVFSIVPFSALALESADFVLNGGTVTVDGTENKTVNVVFEAKNSVTVIALQGTFTDESDYLTLSGNVSPVALAGTNYFDTASGTVVYADANLEGYAVAANGNVMTAVYTVDKDTPTGTYEVEFYLISVQDYDFNKVNEQTYTATINVTNTSGGGEPAPTAEYTITATASAAEVKVGETVTVDVVVTGAAFNGMQAAVSYDTDIFELQNVSGSAAADKEETNGVVELYTLAVNSYASNTTVATLTFKAKMAGTGAFGFDNTVKQATVGVYDDFASGDAADAAVVSDSVNAYNTYSVNVTCDSTKGSASATPSADVKAGTVVTLTANASNGYEFDSWTVTWTGGNINVVNNMFTMPEGDVSVTASFIELEEDEITVDVREYITGITLITVNGTNESGYTYSGNAMYKVKAYGDVYAWLVEGNVDANTAKANVAAAASGTPGTITEGYEVNGTVKVDFNDAGAAFGCYNVVYEVNAANMAMYLRADVNGDKTVNAVDVNLIMQNYTE